MFWKLQRQRAKELLSATAASLKNMLTVRGSRALCVRSPPHLQALRRDVQIKSSVPSGSHRASLKALGSMKKFFFFFFQSSIEFQLLASTQNAPSEFQHPSEGAMKFHSLVRVAQLFFFFLLFFYPAAENRARLSLSAARPPSTHKVSQ